MFQIYFIRSNTVHVLDGPSVHHQEFKTVHTAIGMCQTDTTECLLAGMRWGVTPNKINLKQWCI